jgi:hypothetical protein
VKLIANLTTFALVPLQLVLTFDVYIVVVVISEKRLTAAIPAVIIFTLCTVLWFIFPQRMRRQVEAQ